MGDTRLPHWEETGGGRAETKAVDMCRLCLLAVEETCAGRRGEGWVEGDLGMSLLPGRGEESRSSGP